MASFGIQPGLLLFLRGNRLCSGLLPDLMKLATRKGIRQHFVKMCNLLAVGLPRSYVSVSWTSVRGFSHIFFVLHQELFSAYLICEAGVVLLSVLDGFS